MADTQGIQSTANALADILYDLQKRIAILEESSITRLSAHNTLAGRIDALEQSTILNPMNGASVYQVLKRIQALEDHNKVTPSFCSNVLDRLANLEKRHPTDEHRHDWTKSETYDDMIECLRCDAKQTFLSPACRDMWINGWLEGLKGV